MGDLREARREARRTAIRWTTAALLLAAIQLAVPSAAEDDGMKPSSAGPDYRGASQEQQVEMLRKLLGVPNAAPEAAPVEAPAPAPQADEPPAAEPPIEVPEPAPATAQKQPKQPAKAPAKKPTPVRRAPKPAAPAKPLAPAPAASAPPAEEVSTPGPADDAGSAKLSVHQVLATLSEKDLPPPGTVINGSNINRWSHVMNPAMQWAMHRGVSAEVVEPKAVEFEPWRIAATERYSAQVTLAPNRKSIRNYVAGLPFPGLRQDDPDLAIKVMFNYENRVNFDDLDGQDFGCITGAIDQQQGLNTRRDGRFGHLRRLYYTGRMIVDPKPEIPNNEGIRYRESLFPVIEPFNNKGAGFSYIRYLDPAKQDDAWLYLPATRRVRRLSTAQRSQGIFGQDMDLDSYTGYGGNPAWMQWRLVGVKTMLAQMHAEHQPVKWQAAPADFEADEAWEPREMYVVEGRSLLPEYAFARRVVYIDRESWLIPYTEIYDDQGKLWKALHQAWGFGKTVRADAGGIEVDEFYLPGYVMLDLQIDHATRCELPLSTAVGDKGWYYNYGEAEGTTEQAFDVSGFLGETH